MADVFISYKSERRPAADHLASILRHHGYNVWVDYEGLSPGEGYAARLEAKVKEARVVLVLWCRLAVQSQWVAKEARWAKERQSYIPVWLEDATLPDAFKNDHTLALAHWNGGPMDGALAPLLRAIGERVGRPPRQDFDAMSREQQTWERYGRPSLARFAMEPPAKWREESASPKLAQNPWRETSRPMAQLTLNHTGAVFTATWSPNGTRIVTAANDSTARVWDASSGQSLIVLSGHRYGVNSAAFHPDGSSIVTAGDDSTARVWDASSGRQLALLGHEGAVRSAAFSPDGTRILTASDDNTAEIWDALSDESIVIFKGHQKGLMSAAFSPDGARVVTGSDDKSARIWDARTGQELRTLLGHRHGVVHVGFSPDGARIVTTGDGTRVWDAATGRNLLTLVAELCAGFSSDGTRIVTGSEDNSALVWDAATGQNLLTMQGHQGWVNSAAFSPDGTRIVTASSDKTAKVWKPG